MNVRTFWAGGLIAVLAGCASTSPSAAFKDVRSDVKARSGHTVVWDHESEDDKEVERAVDDLLARDLTADTAVQIALLNSPSLRATYEELSLAQADLVQAGLLKNPVFSIGRTAWEAEHLAPNLFATVEQDFLDVLTMPLRKRVAGMELERTKLEVGDHVLELAGEVRTAFYEAQAAEQIVAMRRLVAQAAKTSAELAQRQHDAGNMSELTLSSELGLASQAALDLKRSEGEATTEREHLNKLMGLWGHRTAWRAATKLPELPKDEVSLDALEATAIEHRLDVSAARRNVQAMDYALSLAKTTRWTGTVNVAVEAGRLRETRRFAFGPSVGLEIPLFDQRQASIARLEAFKRRSEHDLRALAINVRADVRTARARLLTARGVAEDYGKVVIPLRENIVRVSQLHYDAMLLGVYQLIAAKQSEFDAYRETIEAVRDYWIARSDLERAIGRRLGPPAPTTAPPPAKAPPTKPAPDAAPAHVH